MRTFISLTKIGIGILMLSIYSSCSKEETKENELTFQWFVNGKKFYFDYHTDSATYAQNRYLEIEGNRFKEYLVEPLSAYIALFRLPDGDLVVRPNGINGRACVEEPSWSLFYCTEKFDYLILPSDPFIGQELPEMYDGKNISRNRAVIGIETEVLINDIKYNCVVIKDDWGYIEYWDYNHGLIRYDILKADTVNSYLTLHSIQN